MIENPPGLNARKDSGAARDRDRKRDKQKFSQKILGRKPSLKDEAGNTEGSMSSEKQPEMPQMPSFPSHSNVSNIKNMPAPYGLPDHGPLLPERSRAESRDVHVQTAQVFGRNDASLARRSRNQKTLPGHNDPDVVAQGAAIGRRERRDWERRYNRDQSSDRRADSEPDSQAKQSSLGSNGLPTGTKTSFLDNVRSSGSKAATGAKARGKGFWGKLSRSHSSHERDAASKSQLSVPPVLTTLNLPLVEQTRLTRISKRLEESKDKTEWVSEFR